MCCFYTTFGSISLTSGHHAASTSANQPPNITDIKGNHNCALYAGNGLILEEPTRSPEQNGRHDEHQHITYANVAQRQRSDSCTRSEHKEDIKQVAADYVADGYPGLLLHSGNYRCSQLGQRRSSGNQRKSDELLADA